MADTDALTDQQILALTAVGESDKLGETGMTETICTVMNRVIANLHWMGGSNARNVCLAHDQYDVWWPVSGNPDRQRVLNIAAKTPSYGPYIGALGIAANALAGDLADVTNGAVSYYDSDVCDCPEDMVGKTPCYVNGARIFFDLPAVMGKD